MTSLAAMLRDDRARDAVEAHLSQVHGIDLRDLWRTDEAGRPRLTLRQVAVRLRWLPPDSPMVLAFGTTDDRWGIGDYLLADLWSAQTGKPHPARPKPAEKRRRRRNVRQLDNKLRALERRAQEHESRYAGG